MKLLIDIPKGININDVKNGSLISALLLKAVYNGTPLPDKPTNGKEILIKYCLEHSGEEIYDFLKRLSDASMSWTDSRGFIIEWLEKGGAE